MRKKKKNCKTVVPKRQRRQYCKKTESDRWERMRTGGGSKERGINRLGGGGGEREKRESR